MVVLLLVLPILIRFGWHIVFVAPLPLLLLVPVLLLAPVLIRFRGNILVIAPLLLVVLLRILLAWGNERSAVPVLHIPTLRLLIYWRRQLGTAYTARVDRALRWTPRPAPSIMSLCTPAPLRADFIRPVVPSHTPCEVRRNQSPLHRRHLMFLHNRNRHFHLDSMHAGHMRQGVGVGIEIRVLRFVVVGCRRAVDNGSVVRRRKDVGCCVLGFMTATTAPAAAAGAAGVAAHYAAKEAPKG